MDDEGESDGAATNMDEVELDQCMRATRGLEFDAVLFRPRQTREIRMDSMILVHLEELYIVTQHNGPPSQYSSSYLPTQ
jgi:hypothetical protein